MSIRTGRRARPVGALSRAVTETLEARRLLAAQIVGSSTVYQTIQAAVDAAAPNATITVDPGVYSELVTVYKTLTIKGAQAGVDGRSNARTSTSAESIVNGKSRRW